MTHNEHLRKADELYELHTNKSGDAVHVYIKDGEASVFPTLDNFVRRVYFGQDVERFYCKESELAAIYELENYYSMKHFISLKK